MQFSPIVLLCILASAQASVLSETNIATVLASATSQSSLTVPADARAAIAKLGTGGVTASTLSAADKTAISDCAKAATANNEASKADLGGARGSAGNIAFVANKTTLHACQAAGQQITGEGSDNAVNLLISNVKNLNAQTDAAVKKTRAVPFTA